MATEAQEVPSYRESIAGVLAKARERGVEPEHEELVEKAMRLVNENAKMNTEFPLRV